MKIQVHLELGTNLMLPIGTFDRYETAYGEAFFDAQEYVEHQDKEDDETYYFTSLYLLEGGENEAFEVRKRTDKGDVTECTYYFLIFDETRC